MANNQRKEVEKNEKIIRGLLKLSPNRRCINCNSLEVRAIQSELAKRSITQGPQYVCTSFQTFVCTTCSGVHREFTHRIKSVSMAKFTSDEVAALKEGGNECARKIFFKDWNPQRYPLPDSSNIERLRSFIKDVYVYRRYAREVTRMKSGNIDNSYENGKVGAHSSGSTFEDAHAHRYDERYRPIERSSSERSSKHAYRRNSVHFEVVDNRFRDNRSRNNKTSEDRKVLDVGSITISRLPDCNNRTSVGDISRENVPTFCIGESPRADVSKFVDGAQKNETSSSLTSNDEPSVESKGVNIGNLIDFDVDPQPPDAGEGPSAQPSSTPTDQLSTQCAIPSVNGDCLASFDFITHRETLDSWASLSSLPVRSISSPALASLSETVSSAPFTDQNQPFVQPSDPENASPIGSISSLSTDADAQLPKQFAPSIEGACHTQELQTVSTANLCQAPSRLAEHASAEVETQLSSAEAKSSGRKELPEDLFTASHSSASGPVLGWQTGALHNMPFGAQYNPQSPLLNIPRSPSSANPFDRSHAETFSSYGSLQGALLNMAARQGMLRTSSLGNLSSQYITQYPAVQSPAFSSVAPPTADMHVVRQVPCNFSASGTQRFPGYGGQGAAFISSNSDPELCRGSSQPSTPNSFTRAGNPFS